MAHFALVCPPTAGHINPCAVLARALIRRGHRVTFFQIPPLEEMATEEGLHFEPIGDLEGRALAGAIQSMAALKGLSSARFAIDCSRRLSDLLCRKLPEAFRRAQIDMVLVDQNEPAAASVAEYLGLPFVSLCPGLPLNREENIPPPFFGWPYRDSASARFRNLVGVMISNRMIAPVNRTLNLHRGRWGLKPLRTPDDSFSREAQLCQLTPDFDFPRTRLPTSFHYLGPLTDGAGRQTPFPFEELNGKPLVYISLGTLQGASNNYFRTLAHVCAGLNVQVVIAAGGNPADMLLGLEGSPIVVKYAPQMKLLARASLTITHAGLNTVMQSLSFGVPMVAIPLAHDQPAIAARIAYSGSGEVLSRRKRTPDGFRTTIRNVLENPSFRTSAGRIRESIGHAGGVEKGADIVERVLSRPPAQA